MKVAYLLAFEFNLMSRGLKTLPNQLADNHDKYQWRCTLTQDIVQSSQKERSIYCWAWSGIFSCKLI